MADDRRLDRDAERVRREAVTRRGERDVQDAAERALYRLLGEAKRRLPDNGFNPDVLNGNDPAWSSALDEWVLPEVNEAFLAGLRREAREGTFDATAYSARHLESVRNRLVGVADTVFDDMRAVLRDGWLAGDDIPALTGRVDALLDDSQRWRNRARVIARTEVIGANNAGAQAAAHHTAGLLGHDPGSVVKEWLSTSDRRTRETHITADGQQVAGLDAAFLVGGYNLMQPGDPAGPAREVVQCRCSVLYLYPGDPGYPEDLVPAATQEPPPQATPPPEPPPQEDRAPVRVSLGRRPPRPAVPDVPAPPVPPPAPLPTAGALSRAQYDALMPQSTWTQERHDLIRSALHATPEGRALHDVLDRFQDGGSIARLRTMIDRRLAGESIPEATRAKVDALLDAIRHAPDDMAPETLYRGMTVRGSVDDVLAKYAGSDHIDLSLTSFSSDRSIAVKFQKMTAKGGKNETKVMVEFVGARKKAVPIQNLARDRRLFKEKEWVATGRYRVVGVKKSPSGGIILRVEQESTL